jgi:exoribonuclease-2
MRQSARRRRPDSNPTASAPPMPCTDSLVLYKIHPARVVSGRREDRDRTRGRPDQARAAEGHRAAAPGAAAAACGPGDPRSGQLDEAWELLEGAETNLKELAELVYDELHARPAPGPPGSCWPTGSTSRARRRLIRPAPARPSSRTAPSARPRPVPSRSRPPSWSGCAQGRIIDDDRERLTEVERLANQQTEHSRILKALVCRRPRRPPTGCWSRSATGRRAQPLSGAQRRRDHRPGPAGAGAAG